MSTPGSTRVCNQLICTRNTVPGGIYSLYYFGLLPFALNVLFRLSIFGEVADLPSVKPEIEFIPLPSVIPTTPIIPTSSATKEIVRSHAEDVLNGVTMTEDDIAEVVSCVVDVLKRRIPNTREDDLWPPTFHTSTSAIQHVLSRRKDQTRDIYVGTSALVAYPCYKFAEAVTKKYGVQVQLRDTSLLIDEPWTPVDGTDREVLDVMKELMVADFVFYTKTRFENRRSKEDADVDAEREKVTGDCDTEGGEESDIDDGEEGVESAIDYDGEGDEGQRDESSDEDSPCGREGNGSKAGGRGRWRAYVELDAVEGVFRS